MPPDRGLNPAGPEVATQRPPIATYRDAQGRPYHYVVVRHAGATDLVVHFSAFFGDWGNARVYRHAFQGYFHRLHFLGDAPEHNWLFLCDEYGADSNGTYYTGQAGDLFVERATDSIISSVVADLGVPASRVVTVGSSMGGTAALKFGLMRKVAGIVAICPHIDLDLCAIYQGRMRHVAFICSDGDATAEHNHRYTRQVRRLVDASEVPPPRLYIQSCADDAGVHVEQVLPLVDAWRSKGGYATLDDRPVGGHTSDWATRALLLDAVERLLKGEVIDVKGYRAPPFLGSITRAPLRHQARRRASMTRKWLISLLRRQ